MMSDGNRGMAWPGGAEPPPTPISVKKETRADFRAVFGGAAR